MIYVNERQMDRDVLRIQSLIKHVDRTLNKDTTHIMRAALVFALQSAAKATKPHGTSKLSKMSKKYRFRPLVPIPIAVGYFYADGERIFRRDKIIPKKKAEAIGLVRIKKGYKAWDKKRHGFVYIPVLYTKRDETDKIAKIPGAGAAKAAWLQAYQKLTGKTTDTEGIKSVLHQTRMSNDFMSVLNKVGYASNTSPQAARIGLSKAANKLEKLWLPRIERRIERDWEKRATSFVQALGSLS